VAVEHEHLRTLRGSQLEPPTAHALHILKQRLERHFGDRLAGVYLYGSRARGDHRDDSDVDVAVAFNGEVVDLIDLDDELIDVSYPVQLETGLHMQLWALEAASLRDPAGHRRAQIAEAVLRDGFAV
jgi:antitoxin ChpS